MHIARVFCPHKLDVSNIWAFSAHMIRHMSKKARFSVHMDGDIYKKLAFSIHVIKLLHREI